MRLSVFKAALAMALFAVVPFGADVQEGGRVSGTVVDDRSEPVSMALVIASAVALPGARAAITSETGRFVLSALPGGRFSLSATKPGYVTAEYGAKRPGSPGTRVVVSAGKTTADVTLVLARGAVITGTVRDVSGSPAAGLEVAVYRVTSDTGSEPDTTITDERGSYRLFGLQPGDYMVRATERPVGSRGITSNSTAEVDAILSGLRRGLQSSVATGPSRTVQAFGLAPVYHPSAVNVTDASRVKVAYGDIRAGIDIDFRLVPTTNIHGSVSDAVGHVTPGIRVSIAAGDGTSDELLQTARVIQPDAQGKFAVLSLPAGRYVISATGQLRATDDRPASPVWARREVVVQAADLEGVTLLLKPGLRLTGRLVLDSPSVGPPDLPKLRVTLRGSRGDVRQGATNTGTPQAVARVRADGTFEADGLLPGRYDIGVEPNVGSWRLRSALWRDQDLIDIGVVFDDSDITEVRLALSDRRTSLEGRVLVSNTTSPSDYLLVLFPDDRTLWKSVRRLHTTRPATDGHYAFNDIPPGEYRVALLDDLDTDVWRSPDFMQALVPEAVPVTVTQGRQNTLDLSVRRWSTRDMGVTGEEVDACPAGAPAEAISLDLEIGKRTGRVSCYAL